MDDGNPEPDVQPEQKVRAKKRTEEYEIHEILRTSLLELRMNVLALNKAIDFNDNNARKLAMLINSRARIQQQIFFCVALLSNPRLKLMGDSTRNRDLARLMMKALTDENSAVKKLMDETKERTDES